MRSRPVWRRRLTIVAIAWAALTLISGWCVHSAWRGPDAAGQTAGWLVKSGSNFTQTATLPLWWVNWRLVGLPMRSFVAATAISGFGWGGWAVGGMLALAAADRWVRRGRSRASEKDDTRMPRDEVCLGRRRFLARGLVGGGGVCVASTVASGSVITPWDVRVQTYRVPIEGLPRSLDGLRVVQLSDTHLGAWVPEEFLRHVVRLSLELKPDFYVLTGDYIHMGAAHIRSAAEIFRPLAQDRAAHGVIAVLGNHDHYGDGPAMAAALRGVGVRTIDNDRLFLAAASRRLQDLPVAEGLCLSGVGDLWEDVVDEARALRDVPPEVPRIMLAHNPDSAELIASRSGGRPPRVDLMICGHMHGGQVSLPLVGVIAVPSRFGLKYAHGLVTSPLGPVIVSAGVGMSFVPVRLGVRPEIVEITLVRA